MDDAAVVSVEEESAESSEEEEIVPEAENRDPYSSSSDSDGNEEPAEVSVPAYRTPQRRNPREAGVRPHCQPSRPKRQKKSPAWMATGQWVI